jgi:hypothetical protein
MNAEYFDRFQSAAAIPTVVDKKIYIRAVASNLVVMRSTNPSVSSKDDISRYCVEQAESLFNELQRKGYI